MVRGTPKPNRCNHGTADYIGAGVQDSILTVFHGSDGMVGDRFDAGIWVTPDIIDALHYAGRVNGGTVYLFRVEESKLQRVRRGYRTKAPLVPDIVLKKQ